MEAYNEPPSSAAALLAPHFSNSNSSDLLPWLAFLSDKVDDIEQGIPSFPETEQTIWTQNTDHLNLNEKTINQISTMSDIGKDVAPTTCYSDYLSATPVTSMSYTPVTVPFQTDTQRSMQDTLLGNPGQSFTFSAADYANFRQHWSHLQSSGQVVTQQPQSSEHPRDQGLAEPEQQPESQCQPSPLPETSNQPQIQPFPTQTQIYHSIQPWNTFQVQPQSGVHGQPKPDIQCQPKPDIQSQTKSDPEPQVQPAQQSEVHSVQLSQAQPVSVSHHRAPQPTRVPQPSHLISPLLAQHHPQLPSRLRNSNYLVQPIIARPSTQRVEPKDDSQAHYEDKAPESSPPPASEDNTSQTSLQMQLNNLINSTLSGMPQRTDQDGHDPGLTSADHSATITYGQAVPQPQVHQTVQQTHSTRLLLHDGESADSLSEPNTPQPPSSHSSESDSSDDDRQSVSDNTPSDSSSGNTPYSSLGNQAPSTNPVNFWEQHVSSAKIASSGLAHPKPVRLSNGYPPMFPPGSLPWVNSTAYSQPFQHPYNAGLGSGYAPDPKPQLPPVSTEENIPSESNDKQTPQEEPPVQTVKQEPHLPSQSDALSYFLSEFPRSMDSQPSLQHQHMVSRLHDQSKTSDALTASLASSVPAQPTPEKQDASVNPAIFSNNIFMSPSFFTQQMSGVNTQLPPFSSSPDSNPSPTCTGKDDSAIDVNSSSVSPSSSIESRSSPELTASHLPCMEDSNSSLSDTSLMRSRCSSASSICDTSISSTASSSSSTGATRGKRPNPDPDMGSYKKKSRTSYTPGQLRALERVYMENPYPECDTIDRLARELDIPDQRLRVWFQNKRARMRRQAKQNKQSTPLPQVNPYNAQPMSALMSAASPYSFLPPNAMMAPGQAAQMMPRPYFPYPQGAPGSMMHPGGSLPGAPPQHPSLPHQQPSVLTPQQSQVQRLYSFIAHKQQ